MSRKRKERRERARAKQIEKLRNEPVGEAQRNDIRKAYQQNPSIPPPADFIPQPPPYNDWRTPRVSIAPQMLDKAALAKLADHLEDVIKEVMPAATSLSPTETQPPPESPEEAGAVIETPQLEVPVLIERVERQREQDGRTYEEANWDKLSPKFRDAHNRLLQARGLPTIPPPKVDNYRPPPPTVRKTLVMDPEALAAARQFLRLPTGVPMIPGEEGFTIAGVRQKL